MIRVNDKVIIVANDVHVRLYNGMTGVVARIRESDMYPYKVKFLVGRAGTHSTYVFQSRELKVVHDNRRKKYK